MEKMLWIEDIVERTLAPPFFTDFRIDMTDFANPHKVIARRMHFQPKSYYLMLTLTQNKLKGELFETIGNQSPFRATNIFVFTLIRCV
jgi:hypothetical protein